MIFQDKEPLQYIPLHEVLIAKVDDDNDDDDSAMEDQIVTVITVHRAYYFQVCIQSARLFGMGQVGVTDLAL